MAELAKFYDAARGFEVTKSLLFIFPGKLLATSSLSLAAVLTKSFCLFSPKLAFCGFWNILCISRRRRRPGFHLTKNALL